ncbi:GmrSD restriction endonuclease domain-containing protein [Nocardia otitidiscaviarum]|uniref:GmrSD restriction endonuclease domain-containing protein n=1 Tax=Nocardia otitidiscaviarum TaxID=1823 RepID=UPI00245738A1|nr:DUF262 domain-containing protein [Nocardia otitidiscaviarum]
MATDSMRLRDVLKLIEAGSMQLPDFQREWKWDDQRIRELIATVTLDYPLGVVMTLETGGETSFRARPLAGAEVAETVEPSLLLLDGQQRLTSLFQALHVGRPVQTTDSRRAPIERWYYIDIGKAVGAESDRDDAIVSVPKDKVLRSSYARRGEVDLTTLDGECAAGYFPLHIIFDTDKSHEWQRAFVMLDGDTNWPLWSRFEKSVIAHVREFLIPMIKLPASTRTDAVCSVFERVNTGGVPLNVFELLTATYAGNRDYTAAHGGDYYELHAVWEDIRKSLANDFTVFSDPDNNGSDGLLNSEFLQAVTLVSTYERKQRGRTAGVSCKRRDLLDLPLADFDRLHPILHKSFAWVAEFLAEQFIVHPADLPYRSQLIPLAAVRAILGERLDDTEMRERVARWYWCGVLGEMYGGSTESRFPRDVEQLVAWTDPTAPIPDTIAEAVFLDERLDTLTTRNSAAYKGIIALLAKQGAVDWYYNDGPFTPASLLQHAVDIHQIFPKKWLTGGRADKRANSIVNKTPLSYRASRNLVGAPSTYLPVLASESGSRDEWFDDIVATHLIDPDTLRADDFAAFYADRSRQLLGLVSAAMGRGTVTREAVER